MAKLCVLDDGFVYACRGRSLFGPVVFRMAQTHVRRVSIASPNASPDPFIGGRDPDSESDGVSERVFRQRVGRGLIVTTFFDELGTITLIGSRWT